MCLSNLWIRVTAIQMNVISSLWKCEDPDRIHKKPKSLQTSLCISAHSFYSHVWNFQNPKKMKWWTLSQYTELTEERKQKDCCIRIVREFKFMKIFGICQRANNFRTRALSFRKNALCFSKRYVKHILNTQMYTCTHIHSYIYKYTMIGGPCYI